jgi:putative phosphoesterase
MRLALISDVHGNLPALEAILADIESMGAEGIACLGDVAGFGPQPREVLQRLRELACPVVMGNADDEILNPEKLKSLKGGRIDPMVLFEMASWCAGRLREDDLDYLRSFRPTVGLELEELSLLLFHGSPRSFDEVIVATTPDETLEACFEGQQATFMAGGHTHAQLLRRFRQSTFINPGSVGLPFEYSADGKSVRNPPWAEYALVEVQRGLPNITFRRVPYDVRPMIEAALASGMPHAEWWVEGWRR